MSYNIHVKAYSDNTSKEYQKHLNAVKFCIDNDLSYPKETYEYFKGAICGDNLDDYDNEYVLEYIENGFEIDLQTVEDDQHSIILNVKDIPKDAKKIIIDYS